MTKKPKRSKNKATPNILSELKQQILDLLTENPEKSFNYKQLSHRLGVSGKKDRQKLADLLERLYREEQVEEVKPGKYQTKLTSFYAEGIADFTQKGHAYIIVEDLDRDIFVSSAKLKKALPGDRVKVLIYARRAGRKIEGEVVEILERKNLEYTGNLQLTDKFAFFTPDKRNVNYDVFIPLSKLNGAVNGDKVIVSLKEWPDNAKSPVGEVVKIIGKAGEHHAEIHAILEEYGLSYKFPQAVLKEAESLAFEIPEAEFKKRKDFRKVPTFTIDPDDAKDFDDALSIRPAAEKGLWEVGVHIADVSYYVKPGSLLDKEANLRATSVYLVDRVVPMLPERLSNELCSLRAGEEKLCFSAVFIIDEKGNVKNEWFGRTVILSDHRFAYEQAQEVLDQDKGPYSDELKTLNKIAYALREEKFKNGAIAFESEEVKFDLDEKGKPLGIIKKVRKDAHLLIEDFMLLANKRVAAFVSGKEFVNDNFPYVYRIHAKPDPEKLEKFIALTGRLGYDLTQNDKNNFAKSLNHLLKIAEGKAEENLLNSLAVRTMAKAAYSTKNIGHYGLAFRHYTHFTSPIRRYPDVLVHRLLQRYIDKQKSDDREQLEAKCQHASEMEVKATEAERASIKFKQVEYMQNFIGEEFDGVITGVTEWGFFVEISENKCEGLVHIRELIDDYYFLDEENYRIIGNNSAKSYRLGDKVRVRVLSADTVKRLLDFDVVY